MSTACLVTTCSRPWALARSLPQIIALEAPVLVVDDSRDDAAASENQKICNYGAMYLRVPANRGLACALNIGLAYWLADPAIDEISYFQDDVDVAPMCLEVMRSVLQLFPRHILTGRDAREHEAIEEGERAGVPVMYKRSTAGTHLHATRDYWASVMPIPTKELGAPKPIPGAVRGLGSDVDWWVATRAPQSAAATGRCVVCIPGLVRTFLVSRGFSTWDNEHKMGEDPSLDWLEFSTWRKPNG